MRMQLELMSFDLMINDISLLQNSKKLSTQILLSVIEGRETDKFPTNQTI